MQGRFKGSRGRAANAAQPLGRFIDDPFMLRDSVPCAGHAEHSFWAHERRAAWVRFYRLSAWSHQLTLTSPDVCMSLAQIWSDWGGIRSLKGHGAAVWSVAFSHNSAIVASGSNDRTIRLCRADTGECMETLEGHGNWVRSMAISRDSALVASGSSDSTVRLWRFDMGEQTQKFKSHGAAVRSVTFSHDLELVATGSND